MALNEALGATLVAAIWFSWVGLVIAFVPVLCAFGAASRDRRWQYAVAGLLGGVVGETCGVGSLFLSLWLFCRGQAQPCNTAQGDMGLIITVPVGSFCGSVIALGWTWATLRIPAENPLSSVCSYKGPSRIQNWAYAVAIQIVFWVLATCLMARLMA